MHEFLLFGQFPSSRHDQVLNILSGVTASQPTAYTEQHAIFAPLKAESANAAGSKKSQQQANQQLYYHDLYRNITQPDQSWTLRVNQEPEPGTQHVLSRTYNTPQISDISRYDNTASFRVSGRHIHIGHHFVYGNVVIRLFRLLLNQKPSNTPLSSTHPSLEDYTLLDPSQGYIVEASIRLEDRSNSKLTDSAIKELLSTKKMLQGAIELYAPDRLSLDTRVKRA